MAFFDFLANLIPWQRSLVGDRTAGTGGTPPAEASRATALQHEDWLLSGTWLHLGSSNVQAIRYDWPRRVLEVEFKGVDKSGNGWFYNYFDISPEVAEGMVETDSPGRYVWNRLRDRYDYVRLTIGGGTSRQPTVVRALPLFTGWAPTAHLPAWTKKQGASLA